MLEKSRIFVKKNPKVFIKTFGCQMNVHDSEIIAGILREKGYEIINNEKEAGLIVLNTCAIRDHAESKVYGLLGALDKRRRKNNIDIDVIVCGCVAQKKSKEILKRFPFILGVVGTKNIRDFKDIVNNPPLSPQTPLTPLIKGEPIRGGSSKLSIDGENYYEPGADAIKRDSKYKAWVSIVKGCENFCSYCIVPYVRGKEISRPKNEILTEIKKLSDDGVKEICLLGQNVNSYGNDFQDKYSFVDLLYDVDKLNCISRVKFVTSHPKDISDKLLYAIRDLDSLCEYLHFPCQSGSNKILNLMNRGYISEKYIEIVHKARSIIPNICIGTDIIVGFPGEDENDFNDTVSLMKKIKFDMAYLFKYSIRTGTKAAEMEGHVNEEVKKKRHAILLELHNQHSLESNNKYIGRTVEVLVDTMDKKDNSKYIGRDRGNKIVVCTGKKDDIGRIINVKIENVTRHTLISNQ